MSRSLCTALFTLFVAHVAAGPLASIPTSDFTGHYDLAKSGKKVFALEVTQKGKEATISFSAAHENGSGAAPDGDGEGRLNPKGELEIKFSDSFENSGTAVMRRDGKLFRFSMNPDKVADPRALLHNYGDLLLKRTSSKAPSENR